MRPRLVTGLLQQSASLVRLSDGALVITFGRPGQRFMLSYDVRLGVLRFKAPPREEAGRHGFFSPRELNY